jgi:hypothetical protein
MMTNLAFAVPYPTTAGQQGGRNWRHLESRRYATNFRLCLIFSVIHNIHETFLRAGCRSMSTLSLAKGGRIPR